MLYLLLVTQKIYVSVLLYINGDLARQYTWSYFFSHFQFIMVPRVNVLRSISFIDMENILILFY